MLSRLSSNYQTFRLNIYQYQSDYAAYTEAFIDKETEEELVTEEPVEGVEVTANATEGAKNGTTKEKKIVTKVPEKTEA